MTDKPTRFCTIYFMDGQSMRFSFEALKSDDDPGIGTAIDNMSKTQNLILKLENNLTVIPMNNVRKIDISPAPSKLPLNIVKATLID